MSYAPHIEIRDKIVVVNFFSVTDQSVTQKPELSREEPLKLPGQEKSQFETLYLAAVEEIRTAQRTPTLGFKIERYIEALDYLKQAAIESNGDSEVVQALEQRDKLYKILPKMILENTKEQLMRADQQFSQETLLNHISVAEGITINPQILKELAKLKEAIK